MNCENCKTDITGFKSEERVGLCTNCMAAELETCRKKHEEDHALLETMRQVSKMTKKDIEAIFGEKT